MQSYKRVSHFGRSLFYTSALGLCVAIAPQQVALANPQNPVVQHGSAGFAAQGNTLSVNQQSEKVIIDWNSFDINRGETTRFNQPSQNALAVNRVSNAAQASRIEGNLEANGQVMLLNPNGVMISKTGRVDAAGFIASTADIANADIINNANSLYYLNLAGNSQGIIENQGTITIRDNGIAALVAPQVKNSGIIQARLGKVMLGAGDTVTVDLYGDGLINLAVAENTSARRLVAENSGQIIADGGTVLMTAAAASGVVDSVINTSGLIQAQSLVNQKGKIILTGANAEVNVAGKLDVSGAHQAGNVNIGGDREGKGSLAKADKVTAAKETQIQASSTITGNGGEVIVWSDNHTTFKGSVVAKGGAEGGNGGFVETSSAGLLDVTGAFVNTLASQGEAGWWLLDPQDITIVPAGTVGAEAYNRPTHNNPLSPGDSQIDVDTINNALSNVRLAATQDIFFGTPIVMTNNGVGIYADAGRDIFLDADITTDDGRVDFEANGSIRGSGNITTNGARIGFRAYKNITLNDNTFDAGGHNIHLHASEDAALTNVTLQTAGKGDQAVLVKAGEDTTLRNVTIDTQGGYVRLQSTADLNIYDSNITSNGGDIRLDSDEHLKVQDSTVDAAGGFIRALADDSLLVLGSTLSTTGQNIHLTTTNFLKISRSLITSGGGDIKVESVKKGDVGGDLRIEHSTIDSSDVVGSESGNDGDVIINNPDEAAFRARTSNVIDEDDNAGTITIAGNTLTGGDNCINAGGSCTPPSTTSGGGSSGGSSTSSSSSSSTSSSSGGSTSGSSSGGSSTSSGGGASSSGGSSTSSSSSGGALAPIARSLFSGEYDVLIKYGEDGRPIISEADETLNNQIEFEGFANSTDPNLSLSSGGGGTNTSTGSGNLSPEQLESLEPAAGPGGAGNSGTECANSFLDTGECSLQQ